MPQALSSVSMGIAVRRIKEFSFYINEGLFAHKQTENNSSLLQVEFALRLAFTPETNLVFLTIRAYYHFPGASPDEIIADITVQNVFELPDLKRFQVAASEIILPTNVIITLVGLSISHTRAMMAKNLAGTPMQENLLAIVDPIAVARHFFPKMFEQPATP